MRRSRLAPLLLAAVLAASACSPLVSDGGADDSVRVGFVTRSGDLVRGTGTVIRIELEGGFFTIRGDDGKGYDPINLPKEFEQAGRRVRFTAKIRRDLFSIHMTGDLVELSRIANE